MCMMHAGHLRHSCSPCSQPSHTSEGLLYADSMGLLVDGTFQVLEDELREAVLLAERAILYALGFELRQLNPYKVALDVAGVREGTGWEMMPLVVLEGGYMPLGQAIFNIVNTRCGLFCCLSMSVRICEQRNIVRPRTAMSCTFKASFLDVLLKVLVCVLGIS